MQRKKPGINNPVNPLQRVAALNITRDETRIKKTKTESILPVVASLNFQKSTHMEGPRLTMRESRWPWDSRWQYDRRNCACCWFCEGGTRWRIPVNHRSCASAAASQADKSQSEDAYGGLSEGERSSAGEWPENQRAKGRWRRLPRTSREVHRAVAKPHARGSRSTARWRSPRQIRETRFGGKSYRQTVLGPRLLRMMHLTLAEKFLLARIRLIGSMRVWSSGRANRYRPQLK